MKSRLLILMLLTTAFVCGAQVPDTETFTLQDVVNEVSPSSNDLQTCFDEANSGGFDSRYTSYPANSLLRFRNYQHTTPGYDNAPVFVDHISVPAFNTTALTLSTPSGTISNDMMFIAIVYDRGVTQNTPAGWYVLAESAATNSMNIKVLYKQASLPEGDTNVSFSSATNAWACKWAIRTGGAPTGYQHINYSTVTNTTSIISKFQTGVNIPQNSMAISVVVVGDSSHSPSTFNFDTRFTSISSVNGAILARIAYKIAASTNSPQEETTWSGNYDANALMFEIKGY